MNQKTDSKILEEYKKGDKEKALNMLIDEYKERLYWHIRKMTYSHEDTDDILQNTLVKAWKGLDKFRGDSKLFTWLYRIASNESITFLNSQKKRSMTNIEDTPEKFIEDLESDNYFTGNEIQNKLYAAIKALPEKQRLIFNLRYFEELKYEEIAEITNTSIGSLKAGYHHAVKKIEDFINKY